MSWAIKVIENPDPTLDFIKALQQLPPIVCEAVLDHVARLGESANPLEEFAAIDSLLVYLLHPAAVVTALFVEFENRGIFILAIPFRCAAETALPHDLYIEALWILQNPLRDEFLVQ